MRIPPFFLLALLLAPAAALASNPLAAHQATAAPAAAAPAKPSATIIPGSPLAVLTGQAGPAAPPPKPQPIDTASPYGAGNLGLSLTGVIGASTARALDTFTRAVRHSVDLAPVTNWAPTLVTLPERRGHAVDILLGLAFTVLPALAAERLAMFGLIRPRALVAARAAGKLPLGSRIPAPIPAPAEAELEDDAAETKEVLPAATEADDEARRARRRGAVLAWLRRLARGTVHLLLSLLPVAAFVLVSGIILGTGLIATRQARLCIVVVCNAYLACRLTLEALRFLFAPRIPALRLLRASNAHANAVVNAVRLLLFTGMLGYALISISEVLGLSKAGTTVLIHLLGLALHVEVALMIWHSRLVVGRWIAGAPGKTGTLAAARRHFGRIWHIPALLYILALWVALAGGVHNAFGLMLRLILVLSVTVGVGRLVWRGSLWLLDHLLPEDLDSTASHATVYARARAYSPLIRILLQVVIVLSCTVLILEGWGIQIVPWLDKDRFTRGLLSAFISIVIIAAAALILWEAINTLLDARVERLSAAGKVRQAARLRTLLPMLRATIGVPIALVAGLIALSRIGVNAAPLLAGASVLGIAVGFGSQKLVQDIITGLFLLLEDAVQVGDVVNLAGMQGTVERLSIRTIRLRGGDGSMNIIPFSAVTTVTNLTRDFGFAQISIQVGYEQDLPRVYSILEDIAKSMRAETRWKAMMRDDLQIFGLDQFGASALVITGQIRTGPGQHWAVRREFNARVKERFEAEHIDIPYAYLPPPPPVVQQTAPPPLETADAPPAEQPAGGKS